MSKLWIASSLSALHSPSFGGLAAPRNEPSGRERPRQFVNGAESGFFLLT
jgi:hypothetical protein